MKNTSGNTQITGLLMRFTPKARNTKKIKENKKAILYVRCSTEKQVSLEWQEEICMGYCEQHGLSIEQVFSEKESATSDQRGVFVEMIRYCYKNKIGNIVVYAYDRFSRTGDLKLLDDLSEKGIKVHAVTQVVDDQTPSGKFTQNLYMLFSKMENEQRRARVLEGQRNKLKRGEWNGKPAMGYDKRYVTGKQENDHDRPQCFINEKGKLIRQAFHWKDQENITNFEIIERLKPMGLKLNPDQLTRIFRNVFYCGYITGSLLDEGELIKGKHEPLVSEEVFLRVNGIVMKNPQGWNVIRENEELALKASIRCGKCQRRLTGYPQKGKYVYYKCPNTGCGINIRNHKLHDIFRSELSKLALNPELAPALKVQMEATYRMMEVSEAAREKPLKDELTRLRNELETMELNVATGKIPLKIYEKHSASHQRKIAETEENLKNLSRDSSNLNYMLEKALYFACNLLNMWDLMDWKGKVGLQKLLYPQGLIFDAENHAVRTPEINPIFSIIHSLTAHNDGITSNSEGGESENLRQVYLRFCSSNFFLAGLEEIANQLAVFEAFNEYQWSGLNLTLPFQSTGLTESILYQYTSNQSHPQPDFNNAVSFSASPLSIGLSGGTTIT